MPAAEYLIAFEKDPRYQYGSFQPTEKETELFEHALLLDLEKRTESGVGLTRNVLDEIKPLEYSLKWFKRRYFGRIAMNGSRKLYSELVFVRCGGSEEWKMIDYPTETNSDCWWSAEYNLQTDEIEEINYR